MIEIFRFIVFSLLLQFSVVAQTKADLVILNADVRTMATRNPTAEAIAVIGNKIVAVGGNRAIANLAGPATRTIDARGRLVLPGFNDAHVHFTAIGNTFSSINLTDTRTPAEITQRVAHYIRFLPRGRWVLGFGWNNQVWMPAALPTRALIDAVSAHHPVFIYHADGKSALANSLALASARMTRLVRSQTDDGILRDADGEPTGVLRGPAIVRLRNIIPQPHINNWPEIAETASNYAASLGVTSVQDMHSDELADVYRDLARQGKLKTRIYDCSPFSSLARLKTQGVKAGSGDGFVRTGCVKHFSDGDEGDAAELARDVSAADKAALQVMIHAIGPRSNAIVLDIFEKAARENGARDRRFRIEHAYNVKSSDLPRFGKSSIIASMQPWLFYNGSFDDYKRLFDVGAPVAFGSDASITDFNPLLGIQAAVAGKSGITVGQAVRAYTVGSAFAEFQENVKGSIETGKLADLIILSDDIFTIDPAKLGTVRVLTTIVDGKVVFETK